MPELLTKKSERALVDSKDYERYSDVTWFLDSKGYFHSRIGRLHVLILGKRKNRVIDHANQNKLDNRRMNLQFLTNAENVLKQKRHKRNTSGVAGVSFHKCS